MIYILILFKLLKNYIKDNYDYYVKRKNLIYISYIEHA